LAELENAEKSNNPEETAGLQDSLGSHLDDCSPPKHKNPSYRQIKSIYFKLFELFIYPQIQKRNYFFVKE